MLQVYAKPGAEYMTNYALEKDRYPDAGQSSGRLKALDPITCPRCSTLNPPGKKFCGQCGQPTDLGGQNKTSLMTGRTRIRQLLSAKTRPSKQIFICELIKELKQNTPDPDLGIQNLYFNICAIL